MITYGQQQRVRKKVKKMVVALYGRVGLVSSCQMVFGAAERVGSVRGRALDVDIFNWYERS